MLADSNVAYRRLQIHFKSTLMHLQALKTSYLSRVPDDVSMDMRLDELKKRWEAIHIENLLSSLE